jgi:uncharacterized protein YqgV (UPF0045/DUF77 family)
MARPIDQEETPILKKAQADLAQAKRSVNDIIGELNTLVSRWQASGDIDAMNAAMETRADMRDCLSQLERAHVAATRRVVDNFGTEADIVVFGGGLR